MDLNGGPNVQMPEPPFSHLIKEHGSRFDRHEAELQRLRDKLNTLENTMNQLSPLIDRMDADMYNHGSDGLLTKFTKYISDDEATKRTQKEMHQANIEKINTLAGRMGWIIALLILLCTALGLIMTFKGLAKASQLITDPFHSESAITVSETYQNANSPMY